MRSKLFKILSVLVAVIIAFSCCCVPASAQTVGRNIDAFSDFFAFETARVYYLRSGVNPDIVSSIGNSDWIDFTENFETIVGSNSLILTLNGDYSFGAWQWFKVSVTFSVRDLYKLFGYSSGMFEITIDETSLLKYKFLNFSSKISHKLTRFDTSSGGFVEDTVTRYADNVLFAEFHQNNTPFCFDELYVEFYFHHKSISGGNDSFMFLFTDLDFNLISEDEKTTYSIIQNQNENADKIMQNQNENADKILNGDSDLDSSGETGKVDGAIGSVDDATNNALGGKSEQDIQNEVSGALDTDSLEIDYTKAQRMSTFYDRCLQSFGKDYNALLLLSLILGLSAFLIGRRYG